MMIIQKKEKALHSSGSINPSRFYCDLLQRPFIEKILILNLIYSTHPFNYSPEDNICRVHIRQRCKCNIKLTLISIWQPILFAHS